MPVITKEIMLKIEDMKQDHLYIIDARNAYVGVWNEDDKSFIICREKFKSVYLCREYHWDTGAPYGTAKPLKIISKSKIECKDMSGNDDSISYLLSQSEKNYPEFKNIIHDLFKDKYGVR